MADTVSIWTPLAYLAVLVTSLIVFSRVYRDRKIKEISETEVLYGRNFYEEIYYSLKTADYTVPEKLLKMAMQAWAAQDVLRVLKIREAKVPLAALTQNGHMGEDIELRLTGTEKTLDQEVNQIVQQSQTMFPGWQHMLHTAAEIAQNDAARRRIEYLDELKQEFKDMEDPAALERASRGETVFLRQQSQAVAKK